MKTMNLLPIKIHINIAAAAAKSLQSCPTLCDPTDGSHQAPPSLGFSRQEHWTGLPFTSPGKNTGLGCHLLLQCRKVKSESEVTSVVSNS